MLDVQQQQASLERNYQRLPEFKEMLADMAKREIYRKKIRNNFLAHHNREKLRRKYFMYLKEYTITKLFERRSLKLANQILTKKAKERLF